MESFEGPRLGQLLIAITFPEAMWVPFYTDPNALRILGSNERIRKKYYQQQIERETSTHP